MEKRGRRKADKKSYILHETIVNTSVAFIMSLAVQHFVVGPVVSSSGVDYTTFWVSSLITIFYTTVSILRNYIIRRLYVVRKNFLNRRKADKKKASLQESLHNTFHAFSISLFAQYAIISPAVNYSGADYADFAVSFWITVFFTFLSLARNYIIRALHIKWGM